jgi:hypothetical protein
MAFMQKAKRTTKKITVRYVMMQKERQFIKEIQDYMLEIMQKVQPEQMTKSEFTDLMNPVIDLMENEEIFIRDVEMIDGTVRLYY